MTGSRTRRNSCAATLAVLLLALTCITLALGGALAWLLPQRTAQVFGAPRPGMPEWQRAYYAFLLLRAEDALTQPLDAQAAPQPFRVNVGEPASGVAERLAQAGLLSNPQAFIDYLVYRGLDTQLQSGEYELSAAMSAVQIASALQDATPMSVRFGILAGWRVEEIAAALGTSGLPFTAGDFLSAARLPASRYDAAMPVPPASSMEGFFFPGLYELRRDITLEAFFQQALVRFQEQVMPEQQAAFAAHGLDLWQAVTLASMIEREAVLDEEMPMIASVFYNRLKTGMKLDSDPTVQYALGYNEVQKTWWTNPLTAEHLAVGSPYNTYQQPGLPPGPIASPSLAALQAVAAPAESPYFYFRAACDSSGRHLFAETFEQHVQNGCP